MFLRPPLSTPLILSSSLSINCIVANGCFILQKIYSLHVALKSEMNTSTFFQSFAFDHIFHATIDTSPITKVTSIHKDKSKTHATTTLGCLARHYTASISLIYSLQVAFLENNTILYKICTHFALALVVSLSPNFAFECPFDIVFLHTL